MQDCAEAGHIGPNDSLMYDEAMMPNDEKRLTTVFVGDPVDLNGKINFTVRAFDMDGEFEI